MPVLASSTGQSLSTAQKRDAAAGLGGSIAWLIAIVVGGGVLVALGLGGALYYLSEKRRRRVRLQNEALIAPIDMIDDTGLSTSTRSRTLTKLPTSRTRRLLFQQQHQHKVAHGSSSASAATSTAGSFRAGGLSERSLSKINLLSPFRGKRRRSPEDRPMAKRLSVQEALAEPHLFGHPALRKLASEEAVLLDDQDYHTANLHGGVMTSVPSSVHPPGAAKLPRTTNRPRPYTMGGGGPIVVPASLDVIPHLSRLPTDLAPPEDYQKQKGPVGDQGQLTNGYRGRPMSQPQLPSQSVDPSKPSSIQEIALATPSQTKSTSELTRPKSDQLPSENGNNPSQQPLSRQRLSSAPAHPQLHQQQQQQSFIQAPVNSLQRNHSTGSYQNAPILKFPINHGPQQPPPPQLQQQRSPSRGRSRRATDLELEEILRSTEERLQGIPRVPFRSMRRRGSVSPCNNRSLSVKSCKSTTTHPIAGSSSAAENDEYLRPSTAASNHREFVDRDAAKVSESATSPSALATQTDAAVSMTNALDTNARDFASTSTVVASVSAMKTSLSSTELIAPIIMTEPLTMDLPRSPSMSSSVSSSLSTLYSMDEDESHESIHHKRKSLVAEPTVTVEANSSGDIVGDTEMNMTDMGMSMEKSVPLLLDLGNHSQLTLPSPNVSLLEQAPRLPPPVPQLDFYNTEKKNYPFQNFDEEKFQSRSLAAVSQASALGGMWHPAKTPLQHANRPQLTIQTGLANRRLSREVKTVKSSPTHSSIHSTPSAGSLSNGRSQEFAAHESLRKSIRMAQEASSSVSFYPSGGSPVQTVTPDIRIARPQSGSIRRLNSNSSSHTGGVPCSPSVVATLEIPRSVGVTATSAIPLSTSTGTIANYDLEATISQLRRMNSQMSFGSLDSNSPGTNSSPNTHSSVFTSQGHSATRSDSSPESPTAPHFRGGGFDRQDTCTQIAVAKRNYFSLGNHESKNKSGKEEHALSTKGSRRKTVAGVFRRVRDSYQKEKEPRIDTMGYETNSDHSPTHGLEASSFLMTQDLMHEMDLQFVGTIPEGQTTTGRRSRPVSIVRSPSAYLLAALNEATSSQMTMSHNEKKEDEYGDGLSSTASSRGSSDDHGSASSTASSSTSASSPDSHRSSERNKNRPTSISATMAMSVVSPPPKNVMRTPRIPKVTLLSSDSPDRPLKTLVMDDLYDQDGFLRSSPISSPMK